MKDQAKTPGSRRELIGRNEFPPFKRNQIRWALHCYRWKAGLSWEKYPYEIAHALGIRELGEGLNSRDPRGFVLEGQTPTPEKLRLYERFIQKVAPEYARAFTALQFSETLGDFMSRFLNGERCIGNETDLSSETAAVLEQYVYVSPFHYDFPNDEPFLSKVSVIGLRQIGDTPNLRMFVFGLAKKHTLHLKDDAVAFKEAMIDDFRRSLGHVIEETESFPLEAIRRVSFDDTTVICSLYDGFVVPDIESRGYIAVLKNKKMESCLIFMKPFRTVKKDSGPAKADFKDIDFGKLCFYSLITKGDVGASSGGPFSTYSLYSHFLNHEGAQAMISSFGPSWNADS